MSRQMITGRHGPTVFAITFVALLAAALAGCGSSGGTKRSTHMLQSLGKGEGQLNLIEWPGYVQPPWVKPFEQQTGCQDPQQGRRHLGPDGPADAHGPVRRRLGIGQRD